MPRSGRVVSPSRRLSRRPPAAPAPAPAHEACPAPLSPGRRSSQSQRRSRVPRRSRGAPRRPLGRLTGPQDGAEPPRVTSPLVAGPPPPGPGAGGDTARRRPGASRQRVRPVGPPPEKITQDLFGRRTRRLVPPSPPARGTRRGARAARSPRARRGAAHPALRRRAPAARATARHPECIQRS